MQVLANPLKAPVLNILWDHPSGLSEYELITSLKASGLLTEHANTPDELKLFKHHFMVMNALYSLQEELANAQQFLSISPLVICIHRLGSNESTAKALNEQEAAPEVKSYYLDWVNYHTADEESVEKLLNQFWERYLASDQRYWAFTVFEIAPESNWHEVRKRYQHLSQQHHPDKGGDHDRFIEIQQAYEVLKHTFGKQ